MDHGRPAHEDNGSEAELGRVGCPGVRLRFAVFWRNPDVQNVRHERLAGLDLKEGGNLCHKDELVNPDDF